MSTINAASAANPSRENEGTCGEPVGSAAAPAQPEPQPLPDSQALWQAVTVGQLSRQRPRSTWQNGAQ